MFRGELGYAVLASLGRVLHTRCGEHWKRSKTGPPPIGITFCRKVSRLTKVYPREALKKKKPAVAGENKEVDIVD
jgi:hypothetical protein